MLEANFSRVLLKLFGEMHYWERLRFEVPHYATAVYQQCEDLRVLRENVLLIVRDYNRVLDSLRPNERVLFRERIRSLDQRIRPGMTKLTWASKDILGYVSDCRSHTHRVRLLIESYKASNRAIGVSCRHITEQLLVRVSGKRVHEGGEFEAEQRQHRTAVCGRIRELYRDIVATMSKTLQVSGSGACGRLPLYIRVYIYI